ncbi:MAG TPA: hypothetical protein VH300_11460 [Thermoleophilaceae bacterium]|jgi:hypothetical protein|nr:hypothetical protein [Thermoleophilaceae bacterium]
MNDVEQPSRRILVIANPPCPCPALADEVARRALASPADVVVVAPALNSRLRHWVSDVDAAVVQADERVRLAVGELRERGVSARGAAGDTDPVMAIEDALADFSATEIVIATHPRADLHWLERGLIRKAAARFELPVTEVVAI